MRKLLLLRGAPGCGKSTWVKEHGLEHYTVCPDDIRLLCRSLVQDIDTLFKISNSDEYYVWKKVYDIVDYRMSKGELTIIDATNSRTRDITKFKELALKYRYEIYIVDFTNVPIEETKRRNKQRLEYKQVPESDIDLMYERFKTDIVPRGIEIIRPDELLKLLYHMEKFSKYEKIHIFGDIHGCYTVLDRYLTEHGGIRHNELYIFTGDYLDRGLENVEMMKFLLQNYTRKNMIFLEGNHEKWLWNWCNDSDELSQEFRDNTKHQLEAEYINKYDVRKFCRRLEPCIYFKYVGKLYVVTHGGITNMKTNLAYISTDQLIHGVGKYKEVDKVEEAFAKNTPPNMYQIHGHRNPYESPINKNPKNFNLEGAVERGGELRVIQLNHNGVKCLSYKNDIHK